MPAQPTPAQSQVSRLNGTRSSGPTTDDGKKTSSRNATRHGLRADRLELSDDERTLTNELRHSLASRIMPADAAERAALEGLIVCEIKLARLDLLEMRVLDLSLVGDEIETPARLPSLSTLDRYRGRVMRERRELESRLEAFKATRSELVGNKSMSPEALRFLADLAERRAAGEGCAKTQAGAANDDGCTNKPGATPQARSMPGRAPSRSAELSASPVAPTPDCHTA